MAKNENIQSIDSEFHWDEEKLIKKITADWTPNFKPSEEFKTRLDNKLQDKIKLTQYQTQEKAELDAVPNRLKWRFYLTGYGYAIVSFVALFLIGFCTNIFTWTLKIPTKYTYLEQDKAFGELVFNYDIDKASNFYYDSIDADDGYVADEEDIEIEEAMPESVDNTNNSLLRIIQAQALWKSMEASSSSMDAVTWLQEEYNAYGEYLLDDWFSYNQTYRFAYKSKLFPKLSPEYPVYKSSWILIWSNTPNQVLKNLKIWNVSFKNFQDLEIAGLYIEQNVENWYSISFDSQSQRLHFYPNDSRQAKEFTGNLPSKKQLIKFIENNLSEIGVSIKNYWDAEIDMENYDEGMWIINVFYPFQIQWKEVWDAEMDEKIWMQISYDLSLQKVVSIIWIDIATYDVSNYPTIDKSYIEEQIEKWWKYFHQWALHEDSTTVLFDTMQIVYIPKYGNSATYYVPAIKWEISNPFDDYKWPRYIFQEIIEQ